MHRQNEIPAFIYPENQAGIAPSHQSKEGEIFKKLFFVSFSYNANILTY